MRILGIHKHFFYRDGASAYFLQVQDLLARHGHDVVPFSMHHPQNLPTPFAKYFVDEVDFRKRAGLLDAVKKAGHFMYSFQAQKKLRALLTDHGPMDVAHLHNIYHHLTPSIVPVLTRHRVPVVMTLHDYKLIAADYTLVGAQSVPEKVLGGLERMLHVLLRSYDKHVRLFLAPSRYMIERCVQAGWKRDRFVHLPYCVDTDAFARSPFDEGYVAYAGRLSHEKGLMTLLDAAARAPELSVRIAGDGPLAEPLRAAVRDRGLRNIELVGFLEKSALRDFIGRAGVVVVPPQWPENYPFAVLEAQAMGKCVVATQVGGIPEQIIDGTTGFLCAPSDAGALASALQRALSLPVAKKDQIGTAARAWVVREHSYAVHYARLMDVYATATRT